jgi:hypothetical protein
VVCVIPQPVCYAERVTYTPTHAQAAGLLLVCSAIADVTHPDISPNLWVNPGEVAGDGVDNDGNGLVDDVNGEKCAVLAARLLLDFTWAVA